MNNQSKKILHSAKRIIVAVLFVVFVLPVILFSIGGWVDISDYNGDGEIKTVSYGVARGYEIEFDQFNPSKGLSATYSLNNLPKLDKRLHFHVRFKGPDVGLDTPLDAIIRLKVFDNNQNMLIALNNNLSEWVKSTGREGFVDVYYSSFAERHIESSSGLDYVEAETNNLRVEIDIDPMKNTFDAINAEFVLISGGSM